MIARVNDLTFVGLAPAEADLSWSLRLPRRLRQAHFRWRARALRLLHTATWVRVPLRYGLDKRGQGSPLRWDAIVALGDYSGDWEELVTALSKALSLQLDALGQPILGWPGSSHTTDFLSFCRERCVSADVAFYAYPEATVADVRSALEVSEDLSRFCAQAGGGEAETFGSRYYELLLRLNRHLCS